LKSDINVYSVSQQFGFSLYYFSRLFKGLTGYSLKEYILLRKISESYQDIISTEKKIIDIAFDYGFSSHESFSRAFNRTLGMNPSQARKQKNRLVPVLSPLTKSKIESIEKNAPQEPVEVELEELLLIGIPFYFDLTAQNDLSKPWSILTSNYSLIEDRIIPEKYYQVQYWVSDQEPDLFYFFIALRVEKIEDIPIQFTAKIIPKQRYLKFQHRGRSNTVNNTYKYIYETFLPESEYSLPHSYNFEYYGDDFTESCDDNSISEIFIPIESRS